MASAFENALRGAMSELAGFPAPSTPPSAHVQSVVESPVKCSKASSRLRNKTVTMKISITYATKDMKRPSPAPHAKAKVTKSTSGSPKKKTHKVGKRTIKTTLKAKKCSNFVHNKTTTLRNLTVKERSCLKARVDWLEGLEAFLSDRKAHALWFGKPCSPSNVKTTISQLRKLESGKGIAHPRANVVFCAGRPLRLKDDVPHLIEQAKAWLDKHGEDKGHGWLLNHPLRKLLAYQRHLVTRGAPGKLAHVA